MNESETGRGVGGLGMMLAFACGALAGIATAMLFAPRSGEETRRRIGEAVDQSKEKVERIGTAAREATSAARTAFVGAMQSTSAESAPH